MADIFAALRRVAEAKVSDFDALDLRLREADQPFVVRGLAKDWPLVAAGRSSPDKARAYIAAHGRDRLFTVSVTDPRANGRLFYDAGMAMNFRSSKGKLPDIFAKMAEFEGKPDAPTIYLGSIDMHAFFDGLHEANHIPLGNRGPLASIWIGGRTRIAAHNDLPNNLACVAVGRRRFTLFPRDQFRNLYLGPIDNTPAGRAVSMVDFHAPDLGAHPRFRQALDHAQVAELEAGDALYIPAMWWHHVEGLEAFNVLVNYWWREAPRWLGQPQDALHHAVLAIRDLPGDQKEHWRDMFDHYVFGNSEDAVRHIPEDARTVLAPLTPESAGRLRSFLLRSLSQ